MLYACTAPDVFGGDMGDFNRSYSPELFINTIVSIQIIYACKKLVNKSKYTDSTAGIPTCKIGTAARNSFGIHASAAALRLASPPYTSDVITSPAAILPK